MRHVATAALFLVAASCTAPPTQLLVVVDTDFLVPAELALVRASVAQTAERFELALVSTAEEVADGRVQIPFSFAVVPEDGDAARPITLTVEGIGPDQATKVVVRVRTGFVPKERRRLDVFLSRDCETVWETCGADQTCRSGSCGSDEAPANQLPIARPEDELPRRPQDCTVSLGMPALVATVTNVDASEPLLAGDFDGDGHDEIAAANANTLSVLDFDECPAPIVPRVTQQSVDEELDGPPLFFAARSQIWTHEKDQIEAFQHNGPGQLDPTGAILSDEDLFWIVGARSAPYVGVVSRDSGDRRFTTFDADRAMTVEVDGGRPAHFESNMFVSIVDGDLRFLQDETSTDIAAGLPPDTDGRDTVVVRSVPDVPGRSFVLAREDEQLLIVRFTDADRNMVASSSVTLAGSLIGEPVAIEVDGSVRVFVLDDSGRLSWCRLRGDVGPLCPLEITSVEIASDVLNDNARLLTAFVDADDIPDLIVTERTRVRFFSALDLHEVATVALNGESRQAGALLHRFYDRFGTPGDLLAIVMAGGDLALVGWARASNGSATRLWPQYRHDGQRSARYP